MAQNKLLDTQADFLAPPWPVHPGDLVLHERDTGILQAKVLAVESKSTLALSDHIFDGIGQPYRILPASCDLLGQTTSVASKRLITSGLNFLQEGVREGYIARNLNSGEYAWVEAVLSPTELLLSRHIFTSIGQYFRVYQGDVIWSGDLHALATRRVLIDADTTETTTSAGTYVKLKELLLYSSVAGYLIRGFSFLVEGKVSGSGQQGVVSLRINGTEKGTLLFSETGYTLKTVGVEESYPDNTLLDVELWAKMNTEGSLTLRVWEIYGKVSDLE